MATLKKITRRLVEHQEAATMVEYALMIVLIAVVCIAIVGALGGSVATAFTNINNGF